MVRIVSRARRSVASSLWGLAVCGLASFVAAQASAAPPSPVAFELQISPYARVLDAVGESYFMDVLWEESCDNPHLRVRARNKPAMMLINDSTSVAPITSFTLGIDVSQPYYFSTGDLVTDDFTGFVKNTMYTDAGVSITGSSVSPDGRTLTVNFNGLTAGKKVIFNVDLDASDMNMFPFPDYRSVLFGAPIGPGELPTDPGTYAAIFTGGGAAPNTQTLSGQFDQMTTTPDFINDVIRPYREMDKVEITVVTGEIPEPAAGLLAAAGGLALLAARRRR